MNIQETANTFEDLHHFFEHFPRKKYSWVYRGQSDASWSLKPKVGREEYDLGHLSLGRFRAWRTKAYAHINLPDNEWEQLAIAQHHGLATLLLDWTENPLVAAFFAVFENTEKDGIVYVHAPGKILMENIIDSPFRLEEMLNVAKDTANQLPESLAFHPNAINERIINQRGVFTIHTSPQKELKSYEVRDPDLKENLFSVRIKAKAKKEILERLNKYGIDYHFLFPDLVGLSKLINSETNRIIHERSKKNECNEN